jgi:hypothetical protein
VQKNLAAPDAVAKHPIKKIRKRKKSPKESCVEFDVA